MKKAGSLVLLCIFLAACASPQWGMQIQAGSIPTRAEVNPPTSNIPTGLSLLTEIPAPTELSSPTEILGSTVGITPSSTTAERLSAEDWKDWPVVPDVSAEMKVLFQHGLALGNNSSCFSKIGDEETSAVWFLTQYDMDPSNFRLGSHTELQAVIGHFSGSFGRVGPTAGTGYTTTKVLAPVTPGTKDCEQGEAALDCELRVNHPSFAIISLGTYQVWQPQVFEPGLRQIIEQLLQAEVIPILSTKADNLEGNQRINTIIARLAYEYNLPLWNFWRAVQPLPGNGLQADHEHLTYSYSDFSNPFNFQSAWPLRNLTALQVLDSVYRGVTGQQ
jgi:hypothetical protein